MAKCRICQEKLQEKWNYCPECGAKTKEEQFEIKVDKIKYLIERQKGAGTIYDGFYANIQSAATIIHTKKQMVIRDELGDFVNTNFGALRILSLLYQKPEYINELFKIGKLLGYFATIEDLKQSGKTEYIGLPYNSDIFWNSISSDKIQGYHREGWCSGKEGFLQFVGANKKEGIIRYYLKESPVSVFKSNKPLCFFEVATLCGVSEALSNVYWTGRETKCECKGDEHCEFEITLEKEYSEPKIQEFSKKELEDLLDQCINNITLRGKTKRKKLGDTIHIIDDQIINYLLISPSLGHNILTKYSGCLTGEQITKKSSISGLEASLNYLIDLFEYLKVGLLQIESKTNDKIKLRMDESVYSSGVKNIKMKLDTFIAGIIEGALNQATNQKWQVEETKCIAKGDDICEFICKQGHITT